MLYTTHIYLSVVSIVLLCGRGDINEIFCVSRIWLQQQTNSVCTWATTVLLHCADSGVVKHMKHFKWHTWPQSRSPNHFKLRTIGQLQCTFISWQFHSTTIPTTDCQTQIFAQAVFCTNNILRHTYYSIVHNYRQLLVECVPGLFRG